MGWGEEQIQTMRSEEMVGRNQERMCADHLSSAVSIFRERPTTANLFLMFLTQEQYREIRCR